MKLSPLTFAKLYLLASHGHTGPRLHQVTQDFWQLVWRKRHWQWRKQIVAQVSQEWNRQHGLVAVEVQSPRPLSVSSRTKLEKGFAGKLELTEQTKPHLLAGAVVTVGDRRYDASLKGRLNALYAKLAGDSILD